jgi:hypothetical protein
MTGVTFIKMAEYSSTNHDQKQYSSSTYSPYTYSISDMPSVLSSSDSKAKRNYPISILCILLSFWEIYSIIVYSFKYYFSQNPAQAIIICCCVWCLITLWLAGIRKNFAKEYGFIKATGLLAGIVSTTFFFRLADYQWQIAHTVISSLLLFIYLGISLQENFPFLRFFAPLKWKYD